MKCRKSAGLDEISAECLKKREEFIVKLLRRLFDAYPNSGEFPEDGKISYLVPIFKMKKGFQNDRVCRPNCNLQIFR